MFLPKLRCCPYAIARAGFPSWGPLGVGIPNVVDRVARQALLEALSLDVEPTFHDSGHILCKAHDAAFFHERVVTLEPQEKLAHSEPILASASGRQLELFG